MRPTLRAVPDSPPRAILYLRQSVSREESISLELQEIAGRTYCQQRGYEVVEVLADPGISGRTWARPAVQRAVGMIEARDVDVIVVWKWSRLSRSRRDWAVAVDRVEGAGGRLESSTEPVDTTTSTGRFTRGMLAELAAFESERIGDTWREAHRRRQNLGLPHNGSPRFGYAYDPTTKSYNADPEQGPLLQELYARHIAGKGLANSARWLESLGVLSPRTGTSWTHRGIGYMLDSGFGAGLLRVHDDTCTRRHTSTASCPQRVYIPGAQEPVISQSQWTAYLEERSRRATLPPRLVSPVSTLSGVVRCEVCGHRMSVHRVGAKQQPRYKCANLTCPAPSSVAMSRAEDAVLAWLPTVAASVDDQAALAPPSNTASVNVERTRLARTAAEAEQALANLTMDYAKRIVPRAAYEAARDALTSQRDEAASALSRMERTREGIGQRSVVAAELLRDWDSLAVDDRNAVLRELAFVWVQRLPDTRRPTIRVLGVWEEQPRAEGRLGEHSGSR